MKVIKTLPTVKYTHKDETLSSSLVLTKFFDFGFNKIQRYIIGFTFA